MKCDNPEIEHPGFPCDHPENLCHCGKPVQCEHRWVDGDIHSDFICAECGERRNIEDDPE